MLLPVIICGVFGGLATIFGKISFSENWIITYFSSLCGGWAAESGYCLYIDYFVRGLSLMGIVGCNAFIVGYFLKAMEQNNTVIVVVISSAVNFLTSGILGQVVFGEKVPVSWFAGSALIVLGMLLVTLSEGSALPSAKATISAQKS